jgi:tetratricopeptide (TPR) repeat protein
MTSRQFPLGGSTRSVLALLAASCLPAPAGQPASPSLAGITVDYPAPGSLIPPDFAPLTFRWRDTTGARRWEIEIDFADGSSPIRLRSSGDPVRIGEIDPECVSEMNQPPSLPPEQATAHTWKPDAATWETIKRRSVRRPAVVFVTGFPARGGKALSRGSVEIRTATDPVGAPIFYRDVPLIPGVGEKGEIRPLPPSAIHLIQWSLRYVGESRSTVLMRDLPTCANCHSFTADGKTLGMDVDGPANDKGLYSLTAIQPKTSIRNEDVIRWSQYRPLEASVNIRVGFMSQVSPDGRYVVTMINDPGPKKQGPGLTPQERVYVANFKDYRFGQVFFPTRGILAWYDRDNRTLRPLPGADDPRYVHTGAFWSPDGKYLVFSRAAAKEPFPEGAVPATYANDTNETQIQYDLYRIPFNGGRGGTPEPIAGASHNGKSNSFAKISPDGRWIVFVQSRNGQLMRPDSELYIVPSGGGTARRLRANTPLMNSWHSFSPNGRWLVFASKYPSPYTQMYLTHIGQDGEDSPALLIENATAANRAVNIPEFISVPPGGLTALDAPATDFYRAWDHAADLEKNSRFDEATDAWKKTVELSGDDARARVLFAGALERAGRFADAIVQLRRAVEIDPDYSLAYNNLGFDLAQQGNVREAVPLWERALALDPANANAHANLGLALFEAGRTAEALAHSLRAVELDPGNSEAHNTAGIALATSGRLDEAIPHLEKAVAAAPSSTGFQFNLGRVLAAARRFADAIVPLERASQLTAERDRDILDLLSAMYGETGRFKDAVTAATKALALATAAGDSRLAAELQARIGVYERGFDRP